MLIEGRHFRHSILENTLIFLNVNSSRLVKQRVIHYESVRHLTQKCNAFL